MPEAESSAARDSGGALDSLFEWTRRREKLAALLIFTGILLAFFYPMLLGNQLSQQHILWSEWPWHSMQPAGLSQPNLVNEGDEAHTFYPLRLAAGRMIRSGELPLWNPYSYGGHVMLGDQQTALLYPVTWLGVILPLAWAWGPMCLLTLLIAAMGVFAFARGIGIRMPGALVAGTAFMLSAPILGWLQWPHASVFALLGWLMLATDRLTKSGAWRDTAWVGLVVALEILAGHPESAILNSFAAFSYALIVIWADRSRRGTWMAGIRKLGQWVLAHLLGALAAGAAVVPFYEAYVLCIEKSAHGLQTRPPLHVWDSILYAVPDLFGRGDSWPQTNKLDFLLTSTLLYVGVGTILLAAIGAWRLRNRAQTKALLFVAVVSAILMFGIPPARLLLQIPLLDTVIVQRVYVYVGFALAVGAGAGVVSLMRRGLTTRALVVWAVAPALALAAAIELEILMKRTFGPPETVDWMAFARFAVTLLLSVAVIALYGRVRNRWALIATLTLTVVVQVFYAGYLNVWLPPDQAHPPTPQSIKLIQDQPGTFRVGTIRNGVELTLMQANASAMYGLESLEGHDPPISARWVAFATHALDQPGYLERLPGGPNPRSGRAIRVLRAMNVRYYLAPPGRHFEAPGFRKIYDGPDGIVYRDTFALPRAFVVGKVIRTPEFLALRQMTKRRFDPRKEAFVPPGSQHLFGKPGGYRSAVAKWSSARQMVVNVPSGPSGWLVVSNAWTPEWKATVDGKDVKVQPTNYASLGVPIGPGYHKVVFTYSAAGFWKGAFLSLIGFALIALFIVGGSLGWRPRRFIEARTRPLPIPAWAAGSGDVADEKRSPSRAWLAIAPYWVRFRGSLPEPPHFHPPDDPEGE